MARPQEWNKEEQAELLLEWAAKEDSMNLLGFTNQQMFPPEYLSRWSKESDAFCQALKIAKAKVAERRERLVSEGKLYHGAWQRGAAVYDSIIHAHEREQKEFESKLKQKELEQASLSLSDLKKGLDEGTIKQE